MSHPKHSAWKSEQQEKYRLEKGSNVTTNKDVSVTSYFEIIWDLQKSCTNSTKNFHIPFM